METESKRSFTANGADLTIAICFLAGGWAMITWGYIIAGGVCLAVAVAWPTLNRLLSKYQFNRAGRHQAMLERETDQLAEFSRDELNRLSDRNAADNQRIQRSGGVLISHAI